MVNDWKRLPIQPERPLSAAVSMGQRNTLVSEHGEGVLQMKYRPRIYYTETDKALMWDRWQKGESLQSIAQLVDQLTTTSNIAKRPFASGQLILGRMA
jgi:hypothetical protein